MRNSLDVSDRIKKVAKARNLSIGEILQSCGLSKNTLSTMQSREYLPRIETIAKLADFLDVSVDYLLGRTENPSSHKATISISGNVSDIQGVIGNSNAPLTINNAVSAIGKQETALLEYFEKLSEFEKARLLIEIANRSKEIR